MAKEKISKPDSSNEETYITPGNEAKKESSLAGSRLEKLDQEEPFSVTSSKLDGKGIQAKHNNSDLMDQEEQQVQESASKEQLPETFEGDPADFEDEVGIVMGTEADVNTEDIELLGDKDQDLDGGDDEDFNRAGLDQVDDDGEPLNVSGANMSGTGEDLDVPGSDPDETSIGDDEENSYFSLGSDDNDEVTEGTP